MPNPDMITLRNKKTGVTVQVPRSQFVQDQPPVTTGFEGIGNDVSQSLSSLLPAGKEMLSSIVPGINNVGDYATSTNPVSTLANLGAGGVESGAALLSSPQILMRYLAEKFPKFGERIQRGQMSGSKGVNEPTFYEALMNFEKEHGLGAQSPREGSVRSAGGLLFGGNILKSLPGMLSRTGAITAEQAGRGGDPVHAAILSMIGEKTGQALGRGINKAAGEVPRANVPPASTLPPGTPPPPPGTPFPTANMAPAPSIPSAYTTISNIPKAAYNVAAAIPSVVKNTVSPIPGMAGRAAASALETAADYTSEIPVAGKLLKPITHPVGGMLASYLRHISESPQEYAKKRLFEDINPEDLQPMSERDAAAKRLNLTYATIPELLESPFESVKQADIGRTKEGMKKLFKSGKEREISEGSAINKLFNLIHTEDLDPIKKSAYQETMQQTVPDEFIAEQTQKPAIQKAMKMVKSNTAFKQLLHDEYGVDFEKVPANSVMFWDMVKRALYDLENKSGRKGGLTESSVYGNTRKSMVDKMDAILPRYEQARNISERGFIKKELQGVFNKKDKTFNNFDSYLKDKENYENLLKRLDDLPQAKQQLKDIKMFSGKMVPLNPSVRAAAVLKRTGMSDARNALEAKKREYDMKYGQQHDVAGVDLMTNPDVMSLLKDYLSKK